MNHDQTLIHIYRRAAASDRRPLVRIHGHRLAQRVVRHALLGPLLQYILDEGLARLVRGAHERPAGAVQEAHVHGALLPHVELVRRDVLLHLEMPRRGPHVLAERDHVDICLSQFCKASVLVAVV